MKPQIWAVVSRGAEQFDIFSTDTEEEMQEVCAEEGYEILEWNGTEEAALRSLASRVREIMKSA